MSEVESDNRGVESIRWAFHEDGLGSLERAVAAYVALGDVSPDSAPSIYMQSLLGASEEPLWTVSEWLNAPTGSWEREWAESRKDRDWLLVAELRVCVLRRLLNQEDWASAFDTFVPEHLEPQGVKTSISVFDVMVWCNKTAKEYGWELPYWFSVNGLPAQPFERRDEFDGDRTDIEVFENTDSLGPFLPTTDEWLRMTRLDLPNIKGLWDDDEMSLWALPE